MPVLLPVAALQMLVASAEQEREGGADGGVDLLDDPDGAREMLLIFSPFKSSLHLGLDDDSRVRAEHDRESQVLRAAPQRVLEYVVAAGMATAVGVVLAAIAVALCAHARMLSER